MTNAKVLIAHEGNVESALAAADLVGLSRSNVFLFGKKEIGGVLPYGPVFLSSERQATLVRLSAEEAKETVAYLCFSSGTTGNKYLCVCVCVCVYI